MNEPKLIDVSGCARCGAVEHEQLLFMPLTKPIGIWVEQDGSQRVAASLTHWAMCPILLEPILGTYL